MIYYEFIHYCDYYQFKWLVHWWIDYWNCSETVLRFYYVKNCSETALKQLWKCCYLKNCSESDAFIDIFSWWKSKARRRGRRAPTAAAWARPRRTSPIRARWPSTSIPYATRITSTPSTTSSLTISSSNATISCWNPIPAEHQETVTSQCTIAHLIAA